MRFALLALALSACSYEAVPCYVAPAEAAIVEAAPPEVAAPAEPRVFAKKPGQDEAIAVVFASFGVEPFAFELEWVEAFDPTCGPRSFRAPGLEDCVYGAAYPEASPPLLRAGWEPGDAFHRSNLVHEMCHLAFGDLDHLGPCGTVRPASKTAAADLALVTAGY